MGAPSFIKYFGICALVWLGFSANSIIEKEFSLIKHIHENEECTVEQGYMLEAILSCCLNMFRRSLKCVTAISRKYLALFQITLKRSALVTSMFCVLWRGGEVAPEI